MGSKLHERTLKNGAAAHDMQERIEEALRLFRGFAEANVNSRGQE